jgi:hypothetical protein
MVRFLLLLMLAGCVPRTTISEADRDKAVKDLPGQRRFLSVAAYVGLFYGDETKLLLHDAPAAELDLLETAGGEPIQPPPAAEILTPGTPVRIRSIEFPTGMIIASRMILTPRYHPWVFLELPGHERPAILVLSQAVSSYDDVRAETDRVLATNDPSPAFQALPQAQREAIARKELSESMGPRALEMAWGYPQKKIVDRPSGSEEWIWAGGKRRAFLQGERLVRWEPR